MAIGFSGALMLGDFWDAWKTLQQWDQLPSYQLVSRSAAINSI